jgi:hypothetical protein
MTFAKFAQKWNNILHRDLGYFFAGLTVMYAISGIALNHINDWDPNYSITRTDVSAGRPVGPGDIDKAGVKQLLADWGFEGTYKKHYYPDDETMKIFFRGGSVLLDVAGGEGYVEEVTRRPVFFEVNYLHYNVPKKLWTWYSDIFAAALGILAVTGLFILKGRKGIKGRGAWLTAAGLLIPMLFLIMAL